MNYLKKSINALESVPRTNDASEQLHSPSAESEPKDVVRSVSGGIEAIHRFLRFQIEEHKTGDPIDIR